MDARTGELLQYEMDVMDDVSGTPSTGDFIGRERALEIAFALTGGGYVAEFELDEDDGYYTYEIEIIYDGKEHEIELDARTGELLEYEVDDQ